MKPSITNVLVIGGGPAGLAAALPACRMRFSVTVIDAGKPRNAGVEAMHTVFSRDGHDPVEVLAESRAQLRAYPADLVAVHENTTIASIERTVFPGLAKGAAPAEDGYPGFLATDHAGKQYRAKKVILATGSADVFPDIPGFAENWPDHIYQCMFCDGTEAYSSGKPVGVVLPREEHVDILELLVTIAGRLTSASVTVYTNGVDPDADWAREAITGARALGAIIEPGKIEKLVNRGKGPEHGIDVVVEGRADNLAFLNYLPQIRSNSAGLLDALGVERQDGKEEVVLKSPTGATNVPGCFAAGDVTQPMMKQVTIAGYTGFMAGGGAVNELLTEEKEGRKAAGQ